MDAFKVLDKGGAGWISTVDLIQALTDLNIAASTEDLNNFVTRFDRLD